MEVICNNPYYQHELHIRAVDINSEEKLKGVLGQDRFEELLKILREQEDDT